jgi:hypothetical protein
MATDAVATLLMGECATLQPEERFSVPRADAGADELRWTLPATHCPAAPSVNIQALYTFGTPRLGNVAFAESVANLMALWHVAHWRVVHDIDVVSLIPRRSAGYSHLHLNLHAIPARRGEQTFDLQEDENAEFDSLPMENGHRRCGQYATGSPVACPVGSWVFLVPNAEGRAPQDRPLSELVRIGIGAKRFAEREEKLGDLPGASLRAHFMEGYGAALGSLARRNDPAPSPAQVCEDAADAVAEVAPRCKGADPNEARKAFINAAARGSCTNVRAIRDIGSFYGSCLPSLRSLTCAELVEAEFDKECLGQLER